MSDSKNEEVPIRLAAKSGKITPVKEGDVAISDGQAQHIAELVSTPAWAILKKVIIPQRKDQVARRSLSEAKDHEQLYFYRGQVYELTQFFKLVEGVAEAYKKRNTDTDDRNFKK